MKPEEKNNFIKELQKDKKVVAMVGDGINDAAALASSHIGIALGGGVGAASEVSSIVLMHNHLSQVTIFPFWSPFFLAKAKSFGLARIRV